MLQPPPLHQEFQVTFRYGVYFTQDILAPHNSLLAEVVADRGKNWATKILFIIDRGFHRHHPHLISDIRNYVEYHFDCLQLACPPMLMLGGEQVKKATAVLQVQRSIHEAGLCRHSHVIAMGGGALIDMVGYAAATAHRGINLIRIPTTVMAQSDASIGVKNSINAFDKKNFIGTFAPPRAVINDCNFLTTLSQRDWMSGVAEAVKVALIKDATFFIFLEEHASFLADRHLDVMQQTIYRCAELHLHHITQNGDPFECGSSRPLDFGHWSAHKLERLSDFGLRHGEAVAIGMALDVTYSHVAGQLSRPEWSRVLSLLDRLGLPMYSPELERPELYHGLEEFREHLGGRLTVMLLHAIGQGREVHTMDPEIIRAAIKILRDRGSRELYKGRAKFPRERERLRELEL